MASCFSDDDGDHDGQGECGDEKTNYIVAGASREHPQGPPISTNVRMCLAARIVVIYAVVIIIAGHETIGLAIHMIIADAANRIDIDTKPPTS